MSDGNSSDSMQQTPPTAAIKGVCEIVLPRTYAKEAYRKMSGAEQEAAVLQLEEETAAEIQRMQGEPYRGPLERCYRVGWLLVRAQRNTHCIREGGPQGTGLIKEIAIRCGVNSRNLHSYRKMAITFSEIQLCMLLEVKLPWHLVFKALNFVGHGAGAEARLQELVERIPLDSGRESRRKFAAWIDMGQRARNAPAPVDVSQPVDAPPDVTDAPVKAG